MKGFEKINLETVKNFQNKADTKEDFSNFSANTDNNKNMSKKRRLNFTRRKKYITLVVVLLIIFFIFTLIIPTYSAFKSAKKTYSQAKLAITALKNQNVELASVELAKTKDDLTKTQKDLNSLWIAGFIPGINFYYGDAQHLAKAGLYGLDSADILVSSIKPYADVLGLKGQGSFTTGSAETRIQTAVQTVGKVTPRIDEIADKLALAKKEIDYIDLNRYPSFLIGKKIKNNLVSARNLTDNGVSYINDAKPLIKVLPEILGEPKEKKYLVLFQNDKELRPTGGFLTAYSIFRFNRGIIHVDVSSDIYTLDATVPNKPTAPAPILKYLPKVSILNLRDTNLSPDFPTSMQSFTDMYETAGGYRKVDGIFAVDTQALVAAMNVLGDIETGGVKFTTQPDPRCGGCPQVIYMLESFADQPVGYVKENRKSIIGDLMYAIMSKAFSSSPKKYWGPLFQTMITQTAEKHILFYIYNKDAQSGIDALNASGRIRSFDGDYLHINEANFGGQKSNMFVTQTVDQNYEVRSDGTIVKTVTVNYKNPFPPSDCNLERGGLCLNATLRDWIRVYVPKGSRLISAKGSEVEITTGDELGKTVFEGFLTVRPRGAAKYTLVYELPFKLKGSSPLLLMIQKQPGINKVEHTITSNNRKISNFELTTDQELKLSL